LAVASNPELVSLKVPVIQSIGSSFVLANPKLAQCQVDAILASVGLESQLFFGNLQGCTCEEDPPYTPDCPDPEPDPDPDPDPDP